VFAASAPRHFKAMARSRQSRTRQSLLDDLRSRLHDHRLAIFASAVAFRALVSLIPLALLGLGLLGALGLKGTWKDSIAPSIEPRVTQAVFHGIDYSARKILSSGTAGVIVFATALVIWDVGLGVSAIMDALNRIHDVQERRSTLRRALTAVALAVLLTVCVVGAALIVTVAPRAGGGLHVLLGIGRWIVAPLVLAFGIGVLVRLAPAERPEKRWASVGSLLVVVSWIVASILFKLWIVYVANFKSAVGSLTGLLVLVTYLFVSAAIFLIGAELDELLRKQVHGRHLSVFELLRRAF
jgi:membrane protein